MEARGDQLIHRRVRQQVARDLLDGELIERKVPVEGVDHPIAVRPHFAVVVDMNAVRVRVPGVVQPIARPVLTKRLGGEELIEIPLVCTRLAVSEKRFEQFRFRRQSGYV